MRIVNGMARVDIWCAFFVLAALVGGCRERGSRQSDDVHPKTAMSPIANANRHPRSTSGMSARQPTATPDPDATVVVRLEAEPAHLNPVLGADALANRVALGDIYEGLLCQRHPTAPAEPCLARALRVNDNGTVWTFTVRDDVSWHDGVPLSSEDIVFTFELFTGVHRRVRQSSRGEPRRPSARLTTWLAADFDDLEQIETPDDTTVVMTFSAFRMGRREAFARVPILPRHVFGALSSAAFMSAKANRRPIGTGPLSFTSWTPGESIIVQRFPDYWGTPAGAARIEYRIIASRTRAIRALGAGTLDVAVRIPVDEALVAEREHEQLHIVAQDGPSYLAAVYNLEHNALAHAPVRRALTLLMDRASISNALFSGYATPISGPYMHDDPERARDITPLPFAPKRARQSLIEGDIDESVTLELLVPVESKTMTRLADIWAADVLAETKLRSTARLQLSIVRLPYADALARMREGRFDIALMAFTTGLNLDLYTRFHSGASENYGHLSDAALDRMLEIVRAEPDAATRRERQRDVQRRIHDLQPYTFIARGIQVALVAPGIGGFEYVEGGARSLWRSR